MEEYLLLKLPLSQRLYEFTALRVKLYVFLKASGEFCFGSEDRVQLAWHGEEPQINARINLWVS